ncbi:MAG: 23S rRNA (guanosine(2251)-2'-O)-methyltransferase RlmB [Alphaproteobacteria bacterium]
MTKHRPKPTKASRKAKRRSREKAVSGPSRTVREPWLYGIHAVLAALANSERRIERLVLTSDAGNSLRIRLEEAMHAGEREHLNGEIMDKAEIEALLPPDAVHQGIALLADAPPALELADIIEATAADDRACVVLLDQATDPHNIGAVARSAAAFGAAAVIVPDRHTPGITGVLAKAASGAMERVALVRVGNLVKAMESLKKAGFWCIGLDGEAKQSLPDTDLGGKVALVLGAEGPGLRRLTKETCDLLVRVPIDATSESLNLSNAAAVALYERSRGK